MRYKLNTLIVSLCIVLSIQKNANAQTATFSYTGGTQTWTVPSCVNSVTIQCWGAQGAGTSGGKGSYATGQLNVTTGQIITLHVGGDGTGAGTGGSGGPTVPNYAGGNYDGGGGGNGYNGGGKSDALIGATELIAAGGGGGQGGGGGGGCPHISTYGVGGAPNGSDAAGGSGMGEGGNGGAGGVGNSGGGGNGTDGGVDCIISPGYGGSGSSGGSAGSGCYCVSATNGGTATTSTGGNGGKGANDGTCSYLSPGAGGGGGGGGGGYPSNGLGGGGGGGGGNQNFDIGSPGGGGGAGGAVGPSYTAGMTSGTSITLNSQTGNGKIIITYVAGTGITVTGNVVANISCYGSNNGSASATVTGGTMPYTYLWSDGSSQTSQTATGLSVGTYTVNVSDNGGCTGTASVSITQPTVLNVGANTTANATCNGNSNGSASSTVSGGTNPYTYSWSNSQTTPNISSLSAGTYTLSVTDNNGCTGSATVAISEPTVLNVGANTTANVSCNGNSNGSASSTVSGGTNPYTYSWSNSQTTPNISSLSAGTYTLSVTDNNGCTGSATVAISEPTVLNVGANTTANVSCNGNSNGSASSTVSGGTNPYTYSWSNSQTTPNISSLSAGTYTLSVTDNNGCTGSATVAISEPTVLNVGANTTANVSCNGNSNGSASSTVSGGTNPYTYSWSNSQTTPNISSLSAGTYTLSVTDNNGCTGSATVAISEPTVLNVGANTTANVSCNGNSNGSASSTVSGGTNPYTYSWSNSQTTPNISSLSAGTYTLSVTDNNGCTGSATVAISEPTVLNVGANTTANVSCNGNSNGSASSTVSGGTNPYTYSWSNSQTTPNISSLSAGTYTLSVTDNNGCTGSATVAISEPTVLNVGANTTANATCNGNSNGSASSIVSGGTNPCTYSWSNSQTTPNISSLSAGTYTLNVTDNNGCTGSATVAISEPTVLNVGANTTANATCNGNSNGSASSIVSGGTNPYTYSWSNSQTTPNISSLSAGTYTLNVTDNNGCTGSATVAISEPRVLNVGANTTANASCNGNSNGSASSTVSGGTNPYTYSWSNSQTTPNISSLSAGTYTLNVTDNNGCTGSATVAISEPTVLNVGANTTANATCNGNSNGSASSIVSGGTNPYTYSWSNSQTTPNISSLSAGTYTLNVTDNNGCTGSATVAISEPRVLNVGANTTANASCNGNSNGSASSTVSGGTNPYTYSWSNSQTTPNISSLSAGTYTLSVTDNNGCTGSATVAISEPRVLNVGANTTANASCNGNSNGSASSTVSGGTNPYTYSWSNSQTTPNISSLSAGTYTLSVTDNNGCTGSATVAISEPTMLTITHDSVSQNGPCNGLAAVTTSGGTSPYTYLWVTGGQTTDTIKGQCAGTYCCIITDNNGCSTTSCVTVKLTTAINNLSNSKDVTIYPNPGTGQYLISGLSKGMKVEIYDYTGRKIGSQQSIDNSQMKINISNQADGLYLIRIYNADGVLFNQQKVIKTE